MRKLYLFTRYPLLLLSAALLLFSACRREDPDKGLPSATQQGLNTLGCKVNGANWIPGDKDWKANYLQSEYIVSKERLLISASRSGEGFRHQIFLDLRNFPAKAGVYELNSIDESGGRYSFIPPRPDPLIQPPREDYSTDPAHKGQITITKFDRINRVVSGTFEFKAKHDNSPATVSITHGRFDLGFYEYQ